MFTVCVSRHLPPSRRCHALLGDTGGIDEVLVNVLAGPVSPQVVLLMGGASALG